MLRFERPYDVATEHWQVSHETAVQLGELVERLLAAACGSGPPRAGGGVPP